MIHPGQIRAGQRSGRFKRKAPEKPQTVENSMFGQWDRLTNLLRSSPLLQPC